MMFQMILVPYMQVKCWPWTVCDDVVGMRTCEFNSSLTDVNTGV